MKLVQMQIRIGSEGACRRVLLRNLSCSDPPSILIRQRQDGGGGR